MSHNVTVTRLPDDLSDDVEYRFGGTHDHRCETYRECGKVWHRHPKNTDGLLEEWGNDRVGHHAYIDGMWMIPDGCALNYVFENEPAESQLVPVGLGTYEVETEWDGDGWYLTVITGAPLEGTRL